ncbi:MAG: hypothetical protein GC153_09395 [Alphaproteobacteria bacterium]|nr:hypothetical protein [Alphaproteobacteria bacterium]
MIAVGALDYRPPYKKSEAQILILANRAKDDFKVANCDPALISESYDRLRAGPAKFLPKGGD